jgi:hypothetical protein
MTLARTRWLPWLLATLSACSSAASADSNDAAAPADGDESANRDSGERGGTGNQSAGDSGAPHAPTVPEVGEIDCRREGDETTTLVFVNRCRRPVTFAGSDITGATLSPGTFACVDIGNASDEIASVRYWGWVGEDPGAERYTLAEFTFNTDFNDFDWYNISHVDAHNLPVSIAPVGRPDCHTLSCPQDFLADCPEVGRVRDASGQLVSCVSPERDDPESPVALYFEACDDAYAWSGDDQHGSDPSPMRACAGEDWDIVFCPPG